MTKPAKVPSWTKDMSLETYMMQLTTWQEINEDVPEFARYHELIEELKKNEDIKGLQRFLADQTLKKRRKMESFELQALREVVKKNGQAVVQNFERKFKEIWVEGKRKSLKESTALNIERPLPTYYTQAEKEHIEAMYMGTESEARKRFNCSRFRRKQSDVLKGI